MDKYYEHVQFRIPEEREGPVRHKEESLSFPEAHAMVTRIPAHAFIEMKANRD